ncbi:unnamed protein product [Symbiodinium natans]|uniref:Uncharacterized protein n=1 Tax=Symbiodinium natans TaxID=878477 RepID=A0A812RZU2_9DINO|nr:unnamed protein product [Symbiodinium natans]
MHGALNAACSALPPRSVADVLLALATHQLCPITLLEELQACLPRVAAEMQPDEALTASWSLAALLFSRAGVLPALVERALEGELGVAEARQLRQIALSLRLEDGAEEAFKSQAPATWNRLQELACESLAEEPAAAAEVAAESLAQRLEEAYVFDAAGPIIMALHSIKTRNDLRRVGNLYYTHAFACAFLQATASGNGCLHPIYSAAVGTCTRHRGQLTSLLPRATNGFWTNVLEDLMQAPPFQQIRDGLLEECRQHEEFRYLSVNATFKINFKVIGQADFHASQSSWENAAMPENEAGCRTLTVAAGQV